MELNELQEESLKIQRLLKRLKGIVNLTLGQAIDEENGYTKYDLPDKLQDLPDGESMSHKVSVKLPIIKQPKQPPLHDYKEHQGSVHGNKTESIRSMRSLNRTLDDIGFLPQPIQSNRIRVNFSADRNLQGGWNHDPSSQIYQMIYKNEIQRLESIKEDEKGQPIPASEYQRILRTIKSDNKGDKLSDKKSYQDYKSSLHFNTQYPGDSKLSKYPLSLAEEEQEEIQSLLINDPIKQSSRFLPFPVEPPVSMKQRLLDNEYKTLNLPEINKQVQDFYKNDLLKPRVYNERNQYHLEKYQVILQDSQNTQQEGTSLIQEQKFNNVKYQMMQDQIISKNNELPAQQEYLKKLMYNIFYTDEALAQQQKPIVMDIHQKKIMLNPANLQEAHPVFSKLKTKTLELLFEETGDLVRMKNSQILYNEGDMLQLWNMMQGKFGQVSGGDTLGEEGLLDEKQVGDNTYDAIRLENAEAMEETFLFEIKRDKWKQMKDLLGRLKLQIDFFTMTNILKKNLTQKRGWRIFNHGSVLL
ncbi:UNKNOWN [Stylonychia lemnae]|uniref:Cyclic nucleotide-binding domain-containing protein n=1 Tax=Stylonychia lemnae TaxID=5949 RepID=A0A078B3S9_STYLE|nr:UNKNOWN [Stylonychia lemnae]|eukprot:CDW89139.1 UNKNOWN [Stylonychia lemnae]